jgi:anti-sigma factor RsiW
VLLEGRAMSSRDVWGWDKPVKGENAGVPKPPLRAMRTCQPNQGQAVCGKKRLRGQSEAGLFNDPAVPPPYHYDVGEGNYKFGAREAGFGGVTMRWSARGECAKSWTQPGPPQDAPPASRGTEGRDTQESIKKRKAHS